MMKRSNYGRLLCFCLVIGAFLAGCNLTEKAGERAYLEGDYATAARKFKAVTTPKGTFLLGLMALKGEGRPQDLEEALRLFRKAADQGDADAQFNLGVMYANGHGVLQNKQTALEWYLKAAAQKNPLAEFNVGLMYLTGDGVMQNRQTGIDWIRKSADHGNQRATMALKDLSH